ncbi:unnamed protein product [Rotaria magnacalcarata]|uniref:Uncharacterized protein n=1 Tax=Rotaria magnacalcarata TaxID=392030 RepID=A0A819Z8T2_9BILA|nr:unnamed protein product [Rotaria magnacalcarata]CAF4170412.1 unnamed protein product [Rotaria magnacalcarata]
MLSLTSDLSALLKKKSKSGYTSTTLSNVNPDGSYKKDQNTKIISKVNIEYLNILLLHLKHYNAYCALCICTRYFGKNIPQSTALLLRCTLKCSGHICNFKCKVHVLNNGYCFVIATNRKFFHRVNEKITRPIRGSHRRAIMDKFKAGGSVYRVHPQYDEKRTIHGKKVLILMQLASRKNLGILQLHDKLAQEMNSEGIIKSALQIVQFRPFCVVAFTEASIRLYDSIVNCPEYVLSWDATGGIVKNSSSKQCLYYKLTITHPNIVDEDSLVPLTFRLSESQTLFTVKQWLLAFKECYRKVFPHKKDSFPRPAIILSDRAALYVFNDENYSAFRARAYRIVTNAAIRNDLSNTNIHACLSHFMLDMRKRVNKYLSEDVREIAMWAIALLVNTSTWPEIKDNWRLICQIIDEEEELNKADSPFKQELQAIYNECLTACIKYNDAFSSSDKASKGTRQ